MVENSIKVYILNPVNPFKYQVVLTISGVMSQPDRYTTIIASPVRQEEKESMETMESSYLQVITSLNYYINGIINKIYH